ncbi:hypothetical protein GNF80_16750 [Clostridium perfringens]|nr:hypothetical protein [Clostridium perfringens]
MCIKSLVKLELLELDINISDNKIDLLINQFKSKVINYCHIDSIPKKLEQTVASMVVDYIKNEVNNTRENELKSIQEGDTTYVFQSKNSTNVLTVDKILINYSRELNSFRKIRGFR